jgi:hypothetical protein
MISLRGKEKLYQEREISLVDIFWLSTLKKVLAAWYYVQYCARCIFFTGGDKKLMGWPATHSIVNCGYY